MTTTPFVGRNQEGGICCIHHGWKYDVAGNCIDVPSVPADQDVAPSDHSLAGGLCQRAGASLRFE